jgi:hypothetical protein
MNITMNLVSGGVAQIRPFGVSGSRAAISTAFLKHRRTHWRIMLAEK